MKAIMSKAVGLRVKYKRVRSQAWVLVAGVLLSQAQPVSNPVLRSFDRVLLLEQKAESSAGVSVGDLNGDGLPDVVLGKGRHWPLFNRVLLNDGHGGFSASTLGKAPDRTYSAALADVDGDGHLDIVVSHDAPDRKLVYLNDGKGHFREFGTFGDSQWSTRYVTLADLNGDGYPDIVAANRGDYPDLVDGKPGKGRQIPTPSYVCHQRWERAFPGLPATGYRISHLDRSGGFRRRWRARPVRASSRWWPEHPALERRQGALPDLDQSRSSSSLDSHGRAAGDLDGDGRPDLAIIDERLKANFIVFNRGGRQFGEPIRLPGPERPPYCVAIADVNRDKRPDIVVGYVELHRIGILQHRPEPHVPRDPLERRQGHRVRSGVRGLRWRRLAGHRGGAFRCSQWHLVQHETGRSALSLYEQKPPQSRELLF
jgi:hypothetical protein